MPLNARRVVDVVLCLLAGAVALSPTPLRTQSAQEAGRSWIGRAAEIEEYLKIAEITRVEATRVGVTRPRHAFLVAGGPCTEMVWKPLLPGTYRGFRESYKSEIAAYEMDAGGGHADGPATTACYLK